MNHSVAVVGLGPRGLYAVECLTRALNERCDAGAWTLHLFDDSGFAGSGPHYASNQSPLNLLNIPLRDVPLTARPASCGYIDLPGYPCYQEWQPDGAPANASVEDDRGFDIYPTRASIGQYLQSRFQSWLNAWKASAEVVLTERTVVSVDTTTSRIRLLDSDNQSHDGLDHVLLTIGHQPILPDKSLAYWRQIVEHDSSLILVDHPYPTDRFLNDAAFTQRTVALRGMGLSMMDTVKALSEGRGGSYVIDENAPCGLRYVASGKEPRLLLPFSLDGLPMTPKPVNAHSDNRFTLHDDDEQLLRDTLVRARQCDNGERLRDAIIDTMASIGARCYRRLDTGQDTLSDRVDSVSSVIRQWLHDDAYEHPSIVSKELNTASAMYRYLAMAQGEGELSIDYMMGQVWKHGHKLFYGELAFAVEGSDVLVPFIQLDQRLKRYAFGPPVDSTQKLLALVEAGLIQFTVADDPDVILGADASISTGHAGWTLFGDSQQTTADVMINTVLESTRLSDACSPVVTQLCNDGVLTTTGDSVGALIARDSSTTNAQGNRNPRIAFLGRLAIGSVVEADALSECFGPQLEHWASSLVSRLVDSQK